MLFVSYHSSVILKVYIPFVKPTTCAYKIKIKGLIPGYYHNVASFFHSKLRWNLTANISRFKNWDISFLPKNRLFNFHFPRLIFINFKTYIKLSRAHPLSCDSNRPENSPKCPQKQNVAFSPFQKGKIRKKFSSFHHQSIKDFRTLPFEW